jgi:hypothetical protein
LIGAATVSLIASYILSLQSGESMAKAALVAGTGLSAFVAIMGSAPERFFRNLILAWLFPFPLVGGIQFAVEARLIVDGRAEQFLDGVGRVDDLASDTRIYVWLVVFIVLVIADYFNQGWFRQRADRQPMQPQGSGRKPQDPPAAGNVQEVDFGGTAIAVAAIALGFLAVGAVFLLAPSS